MDVKPVGAKNRTRMADIARLARVSMMTVSNCFRNPDKVSPTTRLRVMEAAAKLDYVPNLTAGSLASGRSNVVAAIIPSIQNSNFADMIMGLEQELDAHGYHLIISIAESADREYNAVRALVGRNVDGIVLTGFERDESTREILQQFGVPTVETWGLKGPFIDMGVGFSAQTAAREATQLMIDKGLRRIGIAGYKTSVNHRFQERLDGFMDAVTAAALPTDIVALVPQNMGFSGGKKALAELIAQEPKLEGVFCFTDILAAGVIFDCIRREWSVPERLAVVGYGDYEIAAELPPGITTVLSPGNKIGREAARMIVARCSDKKVDNKIVDVGYKIVCRESA